VDSLRRVGVSDGRGPYRTDKEGWPLYGVRRYNAAFFGSARGQGKKESGDESPHSKTLRIIQELVQKKP
jgi:hypothetical protein